VHSSPNVALDCASLSACCRLCSHVCMFKVLLVSFKASKFLASYMVSAHGKRCLSCELMADSTAHHENADESIGIASH
jgi:hypothetical protein